MEVYKSDFNTNIGPSMTPTLRSGDAFILEQCDYQTELRVGDVIVYQHPQKTMDIVHRIIKIKPDGVITRGDNNSKVDPYLVKFPDVKGVVKSLKRANRTIMVSGGTRGIIRHKLMLIRRLIKPPILYPFSLISKLIEKSRIFNFIHPLLKTKIIMFKHNDDTEEIVQVGNKVVGKRLGKNKPWEIKFPYKWFINKKKL